MTSSKQKEQEKPKVAWFPGKKKFKRGSAPTTPFTTKVLLIDGVKVEVKSYEASVW